MPRANVKLWITQYAFTEINITTDGISFLLQSTEYKTVGSDER